MSTTLIKMQELYTIRGRHWLGEGHTHILGWSEAAIDINKFTKKMPVPLRKEIKHRWLQGRVTIHTCYTREHRGFETWLGFDQLLAYSSRRTDTKAPERYFVCQNYTPRPFRRKLLQNLYKHDLVSVARVSWQEEDKPVPGVEDCWLPPQPVERYELAPIEQCLPPPVNVWRTTAFNLITETVARGFPITEKTWQAIWQSRPFVICGAVGTHKLLMDQGYRLLQDIDYEFDSEPNNAVRMGKLTEQIKLLTQKYTPQEIHKRNSKNAKHNRKLLQRQTLERGLPKVIAQADEVSPGAADLIDYMQRVYNDIL